ncbi:hypothetical protein J0H58_01795 [bacterium]|nr:hypothetical protein [bacterium]
MITAAPAHHFGLTPPAELNPAERAAAVAALLAAGLLRHLHPAAFPPPAGVTKSQENQPNRLDGSPPPSGTVHTG